MKELVNAGYMIALLGGLGIAFGLFECLAPSKKAYGFGSLYARFRVKNIKAYNRHTGLLWMVCGLCNLLLGLGLVHYPSRIMMWIVACVAVGSYMASSIYYVFVIQARYKK